LDWLSCAAAGVFLGLLAWYTGRWAVMFRHGTRPYTHSSAPHWAWPWLEALHPIVDAMLPAATRAYLERLLSRAGMAGQGWRAAHIAILQCMALATLAPAALAMAAWAGAGGIAAAGITAVAGILGLWWPCQRLRERARKRTTSILRQLPFMLDMASLCVEAGQNLHGALQQAASHGPHGPLRDELRHALADMRGGVPRIQALRAMAQRTNVPALHSLVALLAQADHMGMSISPVLRAHAEQRRAERFLRAEKLALEAPVKMLLPLVTCIFPCTFLVIAFPVGQRLLLAGA